MITSKMLGIHEHGYWLVSAEDHPHYFDRSLTSAISDMFCGRGVSSIIDIGCGDGRYTKFLLERGFDVDGFDGNPNTVESSGGVCRILDFAVPQSIGHYDLVLCLEVGEHIPAEKESVLFNNIVGVTPEYVVLSWAVKGQKGFGHVNCRQNAYVRDRMEELGYGLLADETKDLRESSTLRWFKRTLLVFKKDIK